MSIRSSVVTLVTRVPAPHGVYETPTETERTVYCTVQSVSRAEHYDALSHGLSPELVLVLSNYAEYQDESLCRFEGREYKVLRTYTRQDSAIELVLERVTNRDV